LELLYGDALSKQDLDGVVVQVAPPPSQTISPNKSQGDLLESSLLSSPSHPDFPSAGEKGTLRQRSSRLQPTDCHNPTFEELLRGRDPNVPRIDRLEEQRVSLIIILC
jgi:hypothetical protein